MESADRAQGPALDARIAAALERVGQATRLLLWETVKGRGLSPMQAQILAYVRDHREALSRAGHIAQEFGLTAATVSDSVSALEAKGLLRRETSASDARVATLKLTDAGEAMARELEGWDQPLRASLAAFPAAEQVRALTFLMRLIERLQQRGVVSVARMCITCRHFRPGHRARGDGRHYCSLLGQPLADSDLRVDCPEHEPAGSA